MFRSAEQEATKVEDTVLAIKNSSRNGPFYVTSARAFFAKRVRGKAFTRNKQGSGRRKKLELQTHLNFKWPLHRQRTWKE